jgi:hypothetical protein
MKIRARAFFGVLLVSLCAPALSATAFAQYFGRNKVEYREYDFRTLRTEHFDIYYYEREASAAQDAARMAERWYARLSARLGHTFDSRQPIILYGSHPEFSQTNVVQGFLDESIGGVTESLRRRVVLPFAPGLAETDHVLGHEIVHAFQIDMVKRQKHPMQMPLWFAEGMAEYLSLGPFDPLTAAWVRDAAARRQLPSLDHLGRRGVSPYRFGHAFWAYLAGRFGDDFIRQVLQSDATGSALNRVAHVAGVEASVLSEQWDAGVTADFDSAISYFKGAATQSRLLTAGDHQSRLNIAPALSPDGRRIVFLSERDQLSVDVFMASTDTGVITRKLLTRTTDQHLGQPAVRQFFRGVGSRRPPVHHVSRARWNSRAAAVRCGHGPADERNSAGGRLAKSSLPVGPRSAIRWSSRRSREVLPTSICWTWKARTFAV